MKILTASQVSVTDDGEETSASLGPEDSLYRIYVDHMDQMKDYSSGWHWHRFMEFFYAYQGNFVLFFSGQQVRVCQGEAVFINSSVLHSIQAADRQRNCVAKGIIFDYHLLSGAVGSMIEQRYLLPFLHCNALPYYTVHANGELPERLLRSFLLAYEEAADEQYGHEIRVQSHMLDWWHSLLLLTRHIIETAPVGKDVSSERLKQMILYIEKHYQDSVTLEKIADAASISTRECGRCFRKCMNTTPNAYLTKYRLSRAAHYLLETSLSVLEISELCGFSSSGYFSKLFAKEYQMTPAVFRRQQKTGILK